MVPIFRVNAVERKPKPAFVFGSPVKVFPSQHWVYCVHEQQKPWPVGVYFTTSTGWFIYHKQITVYIRIKGKDALSKEEIVKIAFSILLNRGSTLKGKNLFPEGANSFLLEFVPFRKGLGWGKKFSAGVWCEGKQTYSYNRCLLCENGGNPPRLCTLLNPCHAE